MAPGLMDLKKTSVKCVVWDLDNTLWNGVLLEDSEVKLRTEVTSLIRELDERGILQSIASKNDHQRAMEKLRQFGVDQFFIYPQINWNSKAASIQTIAKTLNLGLDTFAFIDDQPYEREEVSFSLPQVLTFDAWAIDGLLERPEMTPRFITDDSKRRRLMYLSDAQRGEAEKEFVGPKDEFLASLKMKFTISPARVEDLKRAEELTVRTNQLNTTGVTYSYEELNVLRESADHKLLIAGLEDKFGSYGKIGLTLVECGPDAWTIKLLLMSCRVMHRGVGTILINHLLQLAKDAGVRLRAEFVANDVNRMMYVTYKFGGFKEIEKQGETILLENDLSSIQPFPDYVNVTIE